jgi:transposase
MINAWHRSNGMSKQLDESPAVGPALATALVASVADPKAFRSGRDFSAWIALVPKQHSSGGKEKLGSISKQGDRYLRGLFAAGALAVISHAKKSMAPSIGLGCPPVASWNNTTTTWQLPDDHPNYWPDRTQGA